MNTPKSPLKLNLLWHADFKEGPVLAELLYHNFTRNPKEPFSRDMGIPIEMGTFDKTGVSKNISADEEAYQYLVSIIFIDNRVFDDDSWEALEAFIPEKATARHHQIITVAFDPGVLQLTGKLTSRQCIRLFEVEEAARQKYFLSIHIAHQLIRLLDNKICHDEKGQKLSSIRQPVQVFLSHAKKDGEPIAKRLREHVHEYFGMDTFFDANNIPVGSYFEEVLNDQVQQSIFLAIQTDEFSQSEWCTHELEWAKKNRRPIVILDLLQNGETRSYPYIGNVTTIRSTTENLIEELKGDNIKHITDLLFDKLVLQVLQEGLRLRYHEALVSYLKAQSSDELKGVEISPYPPELLTLVHLNEAIVGLPLENLPQKIIYPNPPIGYREEEIIESIKQKLGLHYEFITPTLLLLSSALDKDNLKKLKVSISISSIQDRPKGNLYVQDMLVEIAKTLMHLEISLAYGGDLFTGSKEGFNFTTILFEIAKTYNRFNTPESPQKITNYSAFPFYSKVDKKVIAEHFRIAKFEKVEPDDIYQIKPEFAEEILIQDNVHTFFARAKCLTKMRKLMTKNTHARIVMGGQTRGFKGRYSGIIEEILLCMQKNEPVFLLGGFGGAATVAKKALLGNNPEELTLSYHTAQSEHYKEGVIAFNKHELVEGEERINYKKLVSFFNEKKSLEDFGLNNQLSREENLRLFHSTNMYEIIPLVLKGLNEIAKSNPF